MFFFYKTMKKQTNSLFFPILAVALILLSKGIQLFMQYLPFPLLQTLSEDFHIPFVRIGLLLSVCTVVSGVSTFWAAHIVKRLGSFRTWGIGILFSALGGIGSSLSPSFSFMVVMYVLLGIGAGFAICMVPILAAQLFPSQYYSFAMSVNLAAHNLFISAAYILPSVLLPLAGSSWRRVIGFWGLAELLLVALVFLLFRPLDAASLAPVPPVPSQAAAQASPPPNHRSSALRTAIGNRTVIFLTVLMTFLVWSNKTISAYLPTYLTQVPCLLEPSVADRITAAISICAVFGALVLGSLGSRWGRLILLSAPAFSAVGAFGLFLTTSPPALILFAGMFGFFYQGWIPVALSQLMAIPQADSQVIGSAVALFNCFGHLITILIPPVAELLLHQLSLQAGMLVMQLPMIFCVIPLALCFRRFPRPPRKD